MIECEYLLLYTVGCGLQETFKNCADIAIMTNDGGRPPTAQQVPPKNMVLVRDSISGNLIPLVVRQVSLFMIMMTNALLSKIPMLNKLLKAEMRDFL